MSSEAAGRRAGASEAHDGRLPWPFLGLWAAGECAALLVADALGGEPAQIVVLFAGIAALAVGQQALGTQPFVEVPRLSRERPAELKRAWLFQALMTPVYLVQLALLVGVSALDVGGGLWFWFYLGFLLPHAALWNSNRFRSAYARFVAGGN